MKRWVLTRYRGDLELAHDAAMNRWLEFRKIPAGKFTSRNAVIAWCLKFLPERCRRLVRQRNRFQSSPSEVPNPSEKDAQRREMVYGTLCKMPRESRELLEYWYYDNLSDREIAERGIFCPGASREGDRRVVQRRRKAAEETWKRLYLEERRQAIA